MRRLDPRAAVLLFYGPDAGLAAERARAAAERFVPDPADPFQLVRLDGDAVAGSDRTRRIRDAVEAALSDTILLGTEEHVRLAERAARELVAKLAPVLR